MLIDVEKEGDFILKQCSTKKTGSLAAIKEIIMLCDSEKGTVFSLWIVDFLSERSP